MDQLQCKIILFCKNYFLAIIQCNNLGTEDNIVTILQIWLDNELLRLILGAHFGTLVTYYVVVLCC